MNIREPKKLGFEIFVANYDCYVIKEYTGIIIIINLLKTTVSNYNICGVGCFSS